MRFLGWCGVVVVGALVTAACGSSEKGAPQGQSGAAGSASNAGSGQGGGGSGSGSGTEAGRAGSSSQAGKASGGSDGIGSGELDASCRERTTNHVAGSEIGLREGVTAQGDRAFLGFYDKKSGEECTFLQDAEGVTRCFPPAGSASDFYLDGGCTQPIEYRGICGRDLFALPVSDDSCDLRRRVFAYGARKAAAVVWERDSSGNCREYGQLDNLYERGAELTPSDYPAVTSVTWRGLGRIAREGYEGPGGLQIVRSFRDEEVGERCSAKTLADGKPYCAPYVLGSFDLTDDSCSKTLLGTKASCSAPAPQFGAARTSQSCVGDTYVEHGEPYTGPLHTRSGCKLASAADTDGYRVSTAKIVPPDRFAAIEPVVDESDEGRLKPVYDTTADGGCWFQGWFDSEQGSDCDFRLTSDEKYRCVPPPLPYSPSGASVIELFTESTCTASVVYYSASCDEASVPKLVSRELSACHVARLEVRPVLAAVPTLPDLWSKGSGGCQPYTYGSGSTFYELGEPLPLETFVAAEVEE